MNNNNERNLNSPVQPPISQTQTAPTKKLNDKIIVIIVLAALAGVVSWVALSRQPKQNSSPTVVSHKTINESSATTTRQIDLKDWKTYTNGQYGFEIKYPAEWTDVNGDGTQGDILDIVYQADKKVCAEGVGCAYPGEIFVRGITKKSILLPYNSTQPSVFEDFAKKYNASGLDNQGIVSKPIMISGHEAVQINAPNNLTGPDKALVPNITFLVDYSSDSVIWIEVNYFPEKKDYVPEIFNRIFPTLKFISPPLFTDVKWQEMPFDSSKKMDFELTYDNFKYVQEPAERKEKFIQLPGQLWVATIKNLTDSRLGDMKRKFEKYYDDSLKILGWDWTQNLDNKKISFSGPSADAPLESLWGYTKIQNNKLRLIGLGYQITDYTDVSNGEPIEIKCPCTLKLKVFISDGMVINNFSL